MARIDLVNVLYTKTIDPLKFNYDNLMAPPLYSLLSYQDVFELQKIASSLRLSSKPKEKYKLIDKIMISRGFKFLASGTNRVIYKHLEIPSIIVKVALDRVGLSDNPNEYKNQYFIRPFCTKCFEVSPCGAIGVFERVQPIVNMVEFKLIAEDVFNMLIEHIIGKYVLDDIGSNFFMNYGIREGWGPVLLDYPYLYELDNTKLICNAILETGICGGEIDYDNGFNELHCTKCGKHYFARDLGQYIENNNITVSKGDREDMKLEIVTGNGIVLDVIEEQKTTSTIKPTTDARNGNIEIVRPSDKVYDKHQKKQTQPATTTAENNVVVETGASAVTQDQANILAKLMSGGYSDDKSNQKKSKPKDKETKPYYSYNGENKNVSSDDLSTGEVEPCLKCEIPNQHQLPPADNTVKEAGPTNTPMEPETVEVITCNKVELAGTVDTKSSSEDLSSAY